MPVAAAFRSLYTFLVDVLSPVVIVPELDVSQDVSNKKNVLYT
jgi:hypothetical protein